MMQAEREEKLKNYRRNFIRIQIIEAPGIIMLGLGVVSKFSETAPFPALENPDLVNTMLVVGGCMALWGIYQSIKLQLERGRLLKESEEFSNLG